MTPSLPPALQAYLALHSEFPTPALTAEEETDFAKLEEKNAEYGAIAKGTHPSLRNKERKEYINRLVTAQPTEMHAAAEALATFNAKVQHVYEGVRAASKRLSLEAAILLRPAYEREIEKFRAYLEKLRAVELAQFGLDASPTIQRAAAILKRLEDGAGGVANMISGEPTAMGSSIGGLAFAIRGLRHFPLPASATAEPTLAVA
jgi:hypothetical protein